jgi:hypothetical protein
MSLFNFNAPARSNDETQKIQLIINEDVVEVNADEAKGMTIAAVFRAFASSIGDVSRINRYISTGRIVAGSETVVPGTVYQGAVTSESKGNLKLACGCTVDCKICNCC